MMRLWPSTSDGAAIFGAFISVLGGLFAMAFLGAFAIFVPLLLFPPVNSVRTAVIEVALATAALYLVSNGLKLLSKRRPGYHEDAASPLPTRPLGQPVLLAISLAVAMLLIAYPAWWHRRLASREYAHSRACYAQLRAGTACPNFSRISLPDISDISPQYIWALLKNMARCSERTRGPPTSTWPTPPPPP